MLNQILCILGVCFCARGILGSKDLYPTRNDLNHFLPEMKDPPETDPIKLDTSPTRPSVILFRTGLDPNVNVFYVCVTIGGTLQKQTPVAWYPVQLAAPFYCHFIHALAYILCCRDFRIRLWVGSSGYEKLNRSIKIKLIGK